MSKKFYSRRSLIPTQTHLTWNRMGRANNEQSEGISLIDLSAVRLWLPRYRSEKGSNFRSKQIAVIPTAEFGWGSTEVNDTLKTHFILNITEHESLPQVAEWKRFIQKHLKHERIRYVECPVQTCIQLCDSMRGVTWSRSQFSRRLEVINDLVCVPRQLPKHLGCRSILQHADVGFIKNFESEDKLSVDLLIFLETKLSEKVF